MNLQKLNDEQLRAVQAPLAPTLVLAGAGSGKTRVLTNRILYLVQCCGVNPRDILAITFTNKAANEMKRRLFEFDCQAQFMQISTIHSFCARVLRQEAAALERTGSFSIYDEEEKKSVIKKIVKDVFDDADVKIADDIAECISNIKNNSPDALDGIENKIKESEFLQSEIDKLQGSISADDKDLIKILQDYSLRMKENNAMDFDDLLYFVHKLFVSSEEILNKYRERYKVILIDEFQDTNKVQYEIFRLLGEKYRNIFVVGDDDQSIYSWRGADSYNLKKFKDDFDDCNVFKLEQNYRSTKNILDVANAVISKNTGRFEKVLWTDNERGVKAQLFEAYSERDEAYYVCEQIKNMRYLNPEYKMKDFAVLMRVNALSRAFEQEFQHNCFPYKVYGGFKFFERKEIKDVLSYMRLICNNSDSEAFFRAINVPRRRGLGETTFKKLSDLSAEYGISLVDVISDERNLEVFNSATRKKLLDFYALIQDLSELSRKFSVAKFVHEMLDILQFRQFYKEIGDEDRALNIDEFEESVVEFQRGDETVSLTDYLQSVSLSSDLDEEKGIDSITVATIHAVKGLEFKVVFIVGLESGIFPTSRSTYDFDKLQEERRLMYVAITRAEKRLYLTRAKSRFLWGARKDSFASTYFSEVRKYLTPERKPASEKDLYDDRFLDKLIHSEPVRSQPSSSKSAAEVSQYKVGQIVEHGTFGKGIILRIDKDNADVVFDSAGKKSLNLKFAPLKIVK